MHESTYLKDFQTKENLKEIYYTYIYYSFAIGSDNISHTAFNKNLDDQIEIIHRKLKNKSFKFSRYKLKLLNKGRQKIPREIYIPTIRDRIVLKSIYLYLQSIYTSELTNRMPQDLVYELKQCIKDFDFFIKIDIKNFYPTVSHDILFEILKIKIKSENTLNLINQALQPQKNEFIGGIPQGLAISNILSSIFLNQIDSQFLNNPSIRYFRFVDDILILLNEDNLDYIKSKIEKDFYELKLEIHPIKENFSKSKIGEIKSTKFEYLGYSFSNALISVRKSTVNNLYTSIIQCFSKYRYAKEKNIDFLLFQLNLRITGCIDDGKTKGWIFFFSQINDLTLLKKIDLFISNAWSTFNLDPNQYHRVKKFTKAYYEVRFNFKNSNYFINFDKIILNKKIDILEKVFKFPTTSLSVEEINEAFHIKTKGQINLLQIDLRNFS